MPPNKEPNEAKIREIIPCLKIAARCDMNSSLSATEIISDFFSLKEIFTF
jgi:hypothetical protein